MCCKIQPKRFAAYIDAIKTKCYCRGGSELYRKNTHATFLSRYVQLTHLYSMSPGTEWLILGTGQQVIKDATLWGILV